MYNMKRTLLWVIFSILFYNNSFGQNILRGKVMDKLSLDPLPYVTVFNPKINNGTTTNDTGYFELDIPEGTDSVLFVYLGYDDYILKGKMLRKDSVAIYMMPDGLLLEEVVIKAPKKTKKDTLAHEIFKNVVAHKEDNREKSHATTQFEEYDKTVLSLFNIKSSIKNRKVLRPFRFILENQDSTETGSKFIPLILKETISEKYYQNDPKKNKTIVTASKVSGIEQLRFSDLLDLQFDNVDVYANKMDMNGKSFQMPFADGGLFNYKYFVLDSNRNDKGELRYQLGFVPRNKGDMAFVGKAWIHEPTWAVEHIELTLDKRTNINYVNDFQFTQSFMQINDRDWFKVGETRSTNIAFTKRKHSKSIRMYRYSSRKNIQVDVPLKDTIFKGNDVEFQKDYRHHDKIYWDGSRHDTLSNPENNVYFLIDSLKNTHYYKVASTLGRVITSGYYRMGPVEIGHLHQFISWNTYEGARIRLSLRSNDSLSKIVGFKVYGAFGTRDKKFKYGGEFYSNLPDRKKMGHRISTYYRDDYQRFSLTRGSVDYDNTLNSLLRSGSFTDFVYVRNTGIIYDKRVAKDFSFSANLDYKIYKTIPGLIEFKKTLPDGSTYKYDKFNVFTPSITFFYSPKAKFINALGRQLFLKGNLPRFEFNYSFSKKGWLKSEFNYHKLDFTMKHAFNHVLGRTWYMITATKLFGSVPYPLMVIHPGNQTFLIEDKRFTMMKEGVYAADEQVSLFLEHYFQGFFLNKIPFIKKLQLREVFIYKMAMSRLHPERVDFMDLPANIKPINGYYGEIGFGIDNIGKLLRFDFMWRLSQKNDPDYDRFRLQFTVSPKF